MPSRVVILGANGVIGRALVELLQTEGVPFLALGHADLDLCASEAGSYLATMLRAEDVLVMLAGLSPNHSRDENILARNIIMANNVLAAVKLTPIKKIIYASSDYVYPRSIAVVDESSPIDPIDIYGQTHVLREKMLYEALGASLTILRMTQVCAAHDTHAAYGPNRFINQALANGTITLFGDGEDTRDHIMVEDVAQIIWRAAYQGGTGIFNVATGRSLSFAEVAQIIVKQALFPIQIVKQPRCVPITHRRFDITNLTSHFTNFVFTPLEMGVKRVLSKANDSIGNSLRKC